MATEKKIPLREAVNLSLRGYRILHQIDPTCLPVAAMRAAIDAASPLLTLAISARIIDQLSLAHEESNIAFYVALAVGLAFALAAFKALLQRREAVTRSKLQYAYFHYLAKHYSQLDYEHIENPAVNESLADIAAKTSGNSIGIMALYTRFPDLVQCSIGVLASLWLLGGMFSTAGNYEASFITSPGAVALLAGLLVLSMLFSAKQMQIFQQAQRWVFEVNPKNNTIFSYYHDYIKPGQAGKDIRIFAQQGALREIFARRLNSAMWYHFFHVYARCDGLQEAANAVVGGCVYLLIGLRALAGMYGIGSVVQYIGAVNSLVRYITQCTLTYGRLYNNSSYLPQVYEYLDLPNIKHKGTLTTEKRADGEYEIEFHNVSFAYPGTQQYALKNLSLKFRIGQRLAVVGENGSGKTTMIKLLCRLYDPSEGVITLNGIDIRKYDYDEYMSVFSVVFQDFQLFGVPLGQNVATSLEYDADRAVACLNMAGFGERLQRMPQGLATTLLKDLDKQGQDVSGGEAQKIALARALYKDAPFIVLDEPTAALDPIAEFDIYSRINEIVGGKTAIYISHRLASCRFCDDIAVFHKGELLQRGSHESLLAECSGKYRQLWEAQAQYYSVENRA